MEALNNKVTVEVSVNTERAIEQTTKLVKLLKEASSLANELAESLSELKVNIEV